MPNTLSSAFTPADSDSIYRRLKVVMESAEDPDIRRVWQASLQQSTSERLLRTFVRAVEMALYSIDRSTEERHIDTALLESTIRAILRDMDVRAMRKIPAGLDVYISRSSATNVQLVIPAFSIFTGGGVTFYTRYPINFNIGETVVKARIYVGTIKFAQFESNGTDFQEWLSPEDSFKVSDGRESVKGIEYTDILVRVSGTPVRVTEYDQWWDMIAEEMKAVKDRTTIDGRCQLIFGDSQYGYKPALGTIVQIRYIVTNGSGDNVSTFSSNLVMTGNAAITAYPVFNSNNSQDEVYRLGINGGANEVPASTYRKTGPLLYSSAGTATRRKSAQAWAVNFPGIADALVLPQSKTDPNDRRLMNVKKVCLLKGGDGIDPNDYILSSSQASAWLQHFNKRRPHTVGHVIFYAPVPSSPKLDLVLECEPYVTLALVEEAARQALSDLFSYKPGSLRRTILLSELFDTAKYSAEGIKGVRHNGQINDLVTYARSPTISLANEAALNPSIAAGEYTFYVLAVCDVYNGANLISEKSAPSNPLVYGADGTRTPTIKWDGVVGATGYEIYCRFPSSTQYLQVATVNSKTFQFTMTPSVTSNGIVMPTTQPTQFRFPKLGELLISAVYAESEF